VPIRVPFRNIIDKKLRGNFDYLNGILSETHSGRDTLTWPGGSPESNLTGVTHSASSAPKVQVSSISRVGGVPIIVWTDTPTDTSFQARGRTVDGTSPAAGATAQFDWEVTV
jgi:hypothetical protein